MGLKEIGLMEEFKPMTGPNNPYHDTNRSRYSMGKMMNSKNHFKEGIRQQKLEIPYDPYYAEIWGR